MFTSQVLGFVTAEAQQRSTAGSDSSGSGLWEAQAVLLLWLSILVLIPFDLVILDSSVTGDSGNSMDAAARSYPPLAVKIMTSCQDFLSQPGELMGDKSPTSHPPSSRNCRTVPCAMGSTVLCCASSGQQAGSDPHMLPGCPTSLACLAADIISDSISSDNRPSWCLVATGVGHLHNKGLGACTGCWQYATAYHAAGSHIVALNLWLPMTKTQLWLLANKTLMRTLHCCCPLSHTHAGAVREMAALLLARLLTRPDMPAALADFVAWQQAALASSSGPAAVFLLPGVLQALAQIYKLGRREQLLQMAPCVWQQLSTLLSADDKGDGGAAAASCGLATNALARKLAVKLAQRVGLAMLPPQLAGWRYVRAAADLSNNLAAAPAPAAAAAAANAAAAIDNGDRESAAAGAGAEGEADGSVQEDVLLEVPAEIEDVLGALLSSCSDRDTVVRWSAAKGVGRLAACLPQELAEEVVLSVLGLLSPAGGRLEL